MASPLEDLKAEIVAAEAARRLKRAHLRVVPQEPRTVPYAASKAWKVTTGANVSVIAVGDFT